VRKTSPFGDSMVLFGTRLCPTGEGTAPIIIPDLGNLHIVQSTRELEGRRDPEEGGRGASREMLSRLMSLSRYRPRRRVVLVFRSVLSASSTLDGRKLRIRMLLACRSHRRDRPFPLARVRNASRREA